MNGYESDSTIYQESDCEIVVDEKSDTDDNRDEKWTYKPFNLNISEISDLESEDEDPEERQRRIESLAAAIHLQNSKPLGYERGELNMEIDTLSERSEEEGEFEEQKPRQRSRRPSGRKRSMTRDRNVAKIRSETTTIDNIIMFNLSDIAGGATKQVMKIGSAEKMYNQEDGVLGM